MSVLVSDKSVPFAQALAGTLRGKDWSVVLLADLGGDPGETTPRGDASLQEIPWNRPSSLSAETVGLSVRNAFGGLDHAVIVFDIPYLSETVASGDRVSLVAASDRFIRGYLLLVHELSGLLVRQGKGRLTFVVRELGAGASSAGQQNTAIAVAGSAFVRLAEETARVLSSSGNAALQALLVKLEDGDESLNLEWLAERLANPVAPRSAGTWVKAGSRGLFGVL